MSDGDFVVEYRPQKCANCGAKERLKKCGRCRIVSYCGKACQTAHWPRHKSDGCFDSRTEESAAIRTGALHFRFLNERPDRSVEEHGTDTHPMQPAGMPQLKRLLELYRPMNLCHVQDRWSHESNARPEARMMMIDRDVPLGEYGRCARNVQRVVDARGGAAVYGWSVWEGEYMVECEGHVVWRPAEHNVFINVTPMRGGSAYSGLFLPDGNVYLQCTTRGPMPSSLIFWK
jgi:hypothetical protein